MIEYSEQAVLVLTQTEIDASLIALSVLIIIVIISSFKYIKKTL